MTGPWPRRTAYATAALLLVVALVALVRTPRATGEREEDAERAVVARALDCQPWDLKPASDRVTVAEYPWGTVRTAVWLLEHPDHPTARAEVDVDGLSVTFACWDIAPAQQESPVTPKENISHEQLKAQAEQDIERISSLYSTRDKPHRDQAYPERSEHTFSWLGTGDGSAHELAVTYDTATGRLKYYAASVRPPEPQATAPWRLSEEEATRAVLQYLRQRGPQLEVDRVRVVQRTTRSMFAEAGRPVIEVEWQGYFYTGTSRHRGRQTGWSERDVYGVDAETAEVLTEVNPFDPDIREEPRQQ